MTLKKGEHLCWECHKKRDRCRAYTTDEKGDIMWICRQCWKELDYESFLYEHRKDNE